MRHNLLLIYFLIVTQIYAQDFDNYKPLKSIGVIPSDFRVSSSEAYEEASHQIDQKDKKFDRKAQKKFHLVNSFNLHELVYSGKLMYNDVLSTYANKVLDEVLKDNKALRAQIRLYIVKSPYVNAFATNNGMILINEGLLAQLENEAQLAFVLCHELTHFTKKHVINQYVQNERIKRGKTEERYKKSSEQLFAINKYSKETEKEADEVGLTLFKKSQYDLSQIDGVFDVLEYSYLPFDEVVYERSFLEMDKYTFPGKFYADTLKPLPVNNDDDDDSHSTHPSIPKRRSYIAKAIEGIDNKGRKKFVVTGEEEFKKVRKVARFELVEEYISQSNYFEALYCIYLLQKVEPKSTYLQFAKAKCIYAIAKYKNQNEFSSITEYYSDVYGESQALLYLLKEIPSKDFSVYALKYLWAFRKKYDKDPLAKAMLEDHIKDMAVAHFKNLSSFKREFPTVTAPAVVKEDTTEASSKYKKVKKKMVDNTVGDTYYEYAYVGELKDATFESTYEKLAKQAIEEDTYRKSEEYKKQKRKNDKRTKRRGVALGIDKIVMANPFYISVDDRKKDKVKYLASEEAAGNFLGMLRNNASLNKLDVAFLDDIDVRSVTTDKYNDFSFVNDWFAAKSRENRHDVSLVDMDKQDTDAFIKKYGTKYVCWMGTIALRERKTVDANEMIYFIPYLWPLLVVHLATPEYDTYFYAAIYDLEKKEAVAVRTEVIDRNDSRGQMNSIIYDTFYQIKRTK